MIPKSIVKIGSLIVLLCMCLLVSWILIPVIGAEFSIDIAVLGIIVFFISGIRIFLPKMFRIHFNGLTMIMILIFSLIVITNIIIQLFIVLFLIASLVYFLFYLGIYTTCIDQARDQGIRSDDYIKDFTIKSRKDKKERGFLAK